MAVRSIDHKSAFKMNFNIYYVQLNFLNKHMHKQYILLNGFRKAKKGFTAGFHVPLRRGYGSKIVIWAYEWCVLAHARRRTVSNVIKIFVMTIYIHF